MELNSQLLTPHGASFLTLACLSCSDSLFPICL